MSCMKSNLQFTAEYRSESSNTPVSVRNVNPQKIVPITMTRRFGAHPSTEASDVPDMWRGEIYGSGSRRFKYAAIHDFLQLFKGKAVGPYFTSTNEVQHELS